MNKFLLADIEEIQSNPETWYKFSSKQLQSEIQRVVDGLIADEIPAEFIPYISEAISVLDRCFRYTKNLDDRKISGNPLRYTQKVAITGFENWILRNIESPKIGHIVMPMWQWKTNTGIILSELVERKTVYLCMNNSDIDNTIQSYQNHYDSEWIAHKVSKVDTQEKSASRVQVWIFTEFEKALQNGTIDINELGIIIVDEWDINGLSDTRQKFFRKLAENHGLIIVAMSATEIQASGKKLQDTFTGEILRLSIPESLPELYDRKLVPNTVFQDVFLKWSLSTSPRSLKEWIEDDDLTEYMEQTQWAEQIMDFHVEHKLWKSFVMGFRFNHFNDTIIKAGRERGLTIMALTWDEPMEKRKEIISLLKQKKIDGIVWCNLVGRGLDIPNCDLVYNSTLTYSPQLFWQLCGRGWRIDPDNEDKETEFITFLPENIYVNQDSPTPMLSYPLSSSVFFEKWFFQKDRKKTNKSYRLRDLKKEDMLSILEAMDFLQDEKNSVVFGWKIDLLARALETIPQITYSSIKYITKMNAAGLQRVIDKNTLAVDNSETKFSQEDLDTIARYEWLGTENLSLYKERQLLINIHKDNCNKSLQELVELHMPVILAIAKNIYSEDAYCSLEDIVQAWVEAMIVNLEKHSLWYRGRFMWFAIMTVLSKMQREVIYTKKAIRTPSFVYENISKIEKALEMYSGMFFHIESWNYNKKIQSYGKQKWVNISWWETLTKHEVDASWVSPEKKQKIEALSHICRLEKKQVIQALDIMQREFVLWEDDILEAQDEFMYDWDQDEAVNQADLKRMLQRSLHTLTPRQARILAHRFWLNGVDELTLEQCREIFWGVGRERIRQIESKAIRLLKHPARSKQLELFNRNYEPKEKTRY